SRDDHRAKVLGLPRGSRPWAAPRRARPAIWHPRRMRMEPLEYTLDGTTFRGELAWDETAREPRPGVFIAHEGGGLNEHALRRARLLAGAGYVALAGDMYGERRRAANREEAMALLGALRADPPKLRARVQAGVDALRRAHGVDATRIAAIGFCFGGLTVLELARSDADVA